MVDSQVLAFAAAALLVTLSPGPDTFLVLGASLRGGPRHGLATVAGIMTGGLFYVALFAFGVARLLVYSPVAFLAVKLAGAAYLLWLGAGAVRSAFRRASATAPEAAGSPPSNAAAERPLARSYLDGVVTNALNPKVAVFYLAFLPQFMRPDDPIAAKSALLIGIHYALGLVWLGSVALAVGRLGGLLRRDAVRRVLDGVVGAVLTAFGVKLAFASR